MQNLATSKAYCAHCKGTQWCTADPLRCVRCGRDPYDRADQGEGGLRPARVAVPSAMADLFGQEAPASAHARRTDPVTSHEAAASVRVRENQAEVLDLFVRYGPMTDAALVLMARGNGVQQSESGLRTRRSELVAMGKLRDSGRKSKMPSNRNAIVWERTQDSEAAA